MKFKFSLVLLAFVCLLASCKKSNVQGRYIPKEAAFVLHFDAGSLLSKLTWEEIKQGAAYKKAMSDSTMPSSVKTILENPEESGFDIKKDGLFFLTKDSMGGYIALQLPVSDEAKVKTLVESNKDLKVSSEKDFTIATAERIIMKWNKSMFIMVVDVPEIAEMSNNDFMSDDDTETTVTPRDLAKQVQFLFDLKENESLATDDKFSKLMKEKGDMHVWLNNKALVGDMSNLGPMASMVKMDKLYEDNYQTGTINFVDGKIDADLKSYMSKDVAKLVKKYEGGNVDLNMLENVPSDKIAFYMGMNFKPEFIRELIKLTGLEGLVTMGLGMTGINLDDIINFSTGNFLLSIYDLPVSDTSNIAASNDPNYLFAAEINDKDATNKIIGVVKKTMGETDEMNIQIKDKQLAISNNKNDLSRYLNSEKKDKAFASKFKSSNYALYANVKYIVNTLPSFSSDSATIVFETYNKNFWNEVFVTGGKFSNGSFNYSGELTMQDEKTNSLKQLYALINQAVIMEENKKPYEFEIMEAAPADSTIIVPAE